jgi:hypothetical protein
MPTAKPTSDDLSPAMRYYLLVGAWAPGRVSGWVALAQAGLYGQPTPQDIWTTHADALIAEAAAAGFDPFAVTKRRPRGPAFEAWQRTFLALHTY